MPAPLLETKLYVPRPRRGLVPRPRLIERLDRGAAAKLDAGVRAGRLRQDDAAGRVAGGRTGAPTDDRSAAWVSLDRGDNDPGSFWTYVIAALRTRRPEVGARRARAPASPQPPPIRDGPHHAAQRPRRHRRATSCWCSTTTTSSSRASPGRLAFLLDHLPAAAAPGDREPRRSARCRWRGCARAASWSSSARPTCASRPTRPRRTSTR